MQAGLCYDHVQSRMCVQSAAEYTKAGNPEIAECYWKLARHHARCAMAAYAARQHDCSAEDGVYEHYLTGA